MRRSQPHLRAGPDLNRIALEKIMKPESHRIERPPPYVFAEAVARAHERPGAHEGPGAHEELNGAGQGRKLAW